MSKIKKYCPGCGNLGYCTCKKDMREYDEVGVRSHKRALIKSKKKKRCPKCHYLDHSCICQKDIRDYFSEEN